VLGRPSHEYTQKLVDSIPRSDSEWLTAQQAVMGVVPDGD
jgi:ABC-type dipeptide/oligopeptide/nickel transport system ATPase component